MCALCMFCLNMYVGMKASKSVATKVMHNELLRNSKYFALPVNPHLLRDVLILRGLLCTWQF